MYYMWWYSTAEKPVLPVGYELDSGRDLRTETPKGALVEPSAPRRQRRRPNPLRFASEPETFRALKLTSFRGGRPVAPMR